MAGIWEQRKIAQSKSREEWQGGETEEWQLGYHNARIILHINNIIIWYSVTRSKFGKYCFDSNYPSHWGVLA